MGKLGTKLTSPIAKSTSLELSYTTFFARWFESEGKVREKSKIVLLLWLCSTLGYPVQGTHCFSPVLGGGYGGWNSRRKGGGRGTGEQERISQVQSTGLPLIFLRAQSYQGYTQWFFSYNLCAAKQLGRDLLVRPEV